VPGVSITGGCLCGGVRYEVRGPLRDIVVCHCGRCRRTHGDAAGYARCAAGDMALVEDGSLRWFAQEGRERGFCGTCGASLFWRVAGGTALSIAAGTIDPPTGLRTVEAWWVSQASDYHSRPALPERDTE
jgi:hypothetical protein